MCICIFIYIHRYNISFHMLYVCMFLQLDIWYWTTTCWDLLWRGLYYMGHLFCSTCFQWILKVEPFTCTVFCLMDTFPKYHLCPKPEFLRHSDIKKQFSFLGSSLPLRKSSILINLAHKSSKVSTCLYLLNSPYLCPLHCIDQIKQTSLQLLS